VQFKSSPLNKSQPSLEKDDAMSTLEQILKTKSFKLTSVTKGRRIKIDIALDVAPLSKTLSYFTVLIVICDPDAIYTKMDNNISKFISNSKFVTYRIPGTYAIDFDFQFPAKFQSPNLVFTVFMITGKEIKDNLEILSEVFELFLALESDATSINAEFMPFNTHVSSGMLAAWKTMGLGDGAHDNVQFCHCRALRSSQMHLPNQDLCQN
jgi:hypothetical protein